jgi:hypothetical protein
MVANNGFKPVFDYSKCPQVIDLYPEECRYDNSFYLYRINVVANAVFVGFFSLSLLGYLGVFAFTRRNISFTVALVLGALCEIIGYVGRVLSWQNQWEMNGFLIQICCLTIGPAFMAAGIYFCLRAIVNAFGPQNSRLNPAWYPRIVRRHPPPTSAPVQAGSVSFVSIVLT